MDFPAEALGAAAAGAAGAGAPEVEGEEGDQKAHYQDEVLVQEVQHEIQQDQIMGHQG